MNRRTLLTAAVAFAGVLGGCSGVGDGDGSAETNRSAATATEAPTTTAGPATTAPTTARTTGNTDTESPGPTSTLEPTTADGSVTTTGARTETAGMPATETTTSGTTTGVTTATTAPTTASNATERTATDTSTPIPIPDPPSTQEGADVARVAFEKGGSRVVVTGVITAESGCREATLASAQSNGTELVVTVGTERTAGTNAACTQAITPVEYRFALSPDTAPESVTVVHASMEKRRTVTTVKRGG